MLVNPNRPPKSSLAPETVALIAERNRHDVALYEYAGQLLDEAITAQGEAFHDELDSFRATNGAYIERYASEVNTG
jgi:hypothetical protein